LIRSFVRVAGAAALTIFSLNLVQASAQTKVPAAPAQTPTTPTAPAQTSTTPAAPTPDLKAPVFPKPNPEFFTATSPTIDTINAFLEASWGYEENRVWQVEAILKTAVDGVSKVIVYIGDKSGKEKPTVLQFFAMPDGKHIIAGNDIIAFGDKPYAEYRAKLQQEATGPSKGAATKDLELVEFADFQCPHCKEAQANMEKLAVDFPKARIVFQNDPIASIHPEATRAAAYGVCVAKMSGSTAFFQYAAAVFDGQDGLATPDGATMTLNSALTKVGLDPAKVATCADSAETKAEVAASVKLAADLGIGQVPTLVVNGREVPANVPYETLKKIVEYQAKLDGVTL
jgi:protein-disulfide isomerase